MIELDIEHRHSQVPSVQPRHEAPSRLRPPQRSRVAGAKKYKYNTKYNTNTYNTKYTIHAPPLPLPSGVFSFPGLYILHALAAPAPAPPSYLMSVCVCAICYMWLSIQLRLPHTRTHASAPTARAQQHAQAEESQSKAKAHMPRRDSTAEPIGGGHTAHTGNKESNQE
jgi:hypothetical protein